MFDTLDRHWLTFKVVEAPGRREARYVPETREIIIDPDFHPSFRGTAGRQLPASTARVLAHEMGHAVGYPGHMDRVLEFFNIRANENPVATQLGEAPRLLY